MCNNRNIHIEWSHDGQKYKMAGKFYKAQSTLKQMDKTVATAASNMYA